MSLPPVSSGLLERLRNNKAALASRVVEDMFVDPFWTERFPTRGRYHSEKDIGFHVDYVIQAVESNDSGVMERYARWLQDVLTTRGMCTLHLADSFGRLAGAIGDPAAKRHLAAARAALMYESGSARAIQATIREAIVSNVPASIEDPAYHVAYLADAVAHGLPKVFLDHVTWLAGYIAKRGRDKQEVVRALEALRIDAEPAKPIVAAALRWLA